MKAQIVLSDEFNRNLETEIRHTVIDVLREVQPELMAKPDFYNLGAASKAAGVARNTLTSWIKKGLPVVIIGGTKRIKRTDLEAFMESNKI